MARGNVNWCRAREEVFPFGLDPNPTNELDPSDAL